MEKQYVIGIIIVIIIAAIGFYYYKKNKKEDKSLLNKYMETNFSSNFIRNKITSKFYVDPTAIPNDPTLPPIKKLSQANIEILKEIEKSICGSNNINWDIEPNTELIFGTMQNSYDLYLPYYLVKLVGLFRLLVEKYVAGNTNITFNEFYNKLSEDDKDKLVILSLICWQISTRVSDEEYKNYISYDKDLTNFNIKNADMLQEYKNLKIYENIGDDILNLIKEGQTTLTRDDFIKYNILGIMSTFKSLNVNNNFTKETVCSA